MPGSEPSPRRCRWPDALLVTGLALVLLLPTADSLLRLDRSPALHENRTLAAMPTRLDAAWLPGVVGHFEDHFGFRRLAIRANAWLRYTLLRSSPGEAILVGRDTWLFYGAYESEKVAGTLADVRGRRPFGAGALERWRKALQYRHRWLAERGVAYLFVVPPDKHTAYTEQLPWWLVPAGVPSRTDQLVRHLAATAPELHVLDLRPAMLAAKSGYPLYLAHDTHWNTTGAWVASRAIEAEIARLLLGFVPQPPERTSLSWLDIPGGDLPLMLGIPGSFIERVPCAWPPTRLTEKETPREPCEPCGPASNPLLPATTWEDPGSPWRAVLVADSYRNALIPHLRQGFGRLTAVSPTRIPIAVDRLQALVESEHPHIVIESRLERSLRDVPDMPLAER